MAKKANVKLSLKVSTFTNDLKNKQIYIQLLVHKSIKDLVLEYCNKVDIVSNQDDYYLINFPFIDDNEGYNLLLSFGDKCECLKPLEVRNELIKRLNRISRLYKIN